MTQSYFESYEIRACVEHDGETLSFLGKPEYSPDLGLYFTHAGALKEAQEYSNDRLAGDVFWTLYGRDNEGMATAIGDFKSYEDAYRVLNMILVPFRHAAELIQNHPQEAYAIIDDISNQSSTEVRL